MLAYNIFQKNIIPVLKQINKMSVSLVPIHNHFYGSSVTVTGLLAGKDIVSQLKSKSLGDGLWMSHRILNDDGTRTLDDMTIDDISDALGCPLSIGNDSFLKLIKGLDHV